VLALVVVVSVVSAVPPAASAPPLLGLQHPAANAATPSIDTII
jgi:hypothetical protein